MEEKHHSLEGITDDSEEDPTSLSQQWSLDEIHKKIHSYWLGLGRFHHTQEEHACPWVPRSFPSLRLMSIMISTRVTSVT